MIEPMKAKQTLKGAELQDGDIVCFQKAADGKSSEPRPSDADRESLSLLTNQLTLTDTNDSSLSSKISVSDRIDDARVFYDFLLHKRVIRFHPHPKNVDAEIAPFELTLSSKHTYDQFAARVGEKLGVSPTHLRFWTVNQTTGNPKTNVKRAQSQTLQNVLNPPYSTFSNNNQRSDALYFEILDISLSELDTKKALKIIWLSEGITKEVSRFLIALGPF